MFDSRKQQMFHSSVPKWVVVVYLALDWLDSTLSHFTCELMWYRMALLDRYCKCPRCIERSKQNDHSVS